MYVKSVQHLLIFSYLFIVIDKFDDGDDDYDNDANDDDDEANDDDDRRRWR